MKGLFITFEGVECSGKSLQSQNLLQYCHQNNIPAILIREPGGTEIGEELRNIILHQNCTPLAEFFIFSACRNQLVEKVIKPKLQKNYLVISDRFFHSSLAYQGYGRKINLSDIKKISEIAILDIEPKKTFLLQPSYDTMIQRLKEKKEYSCLDRFEEEDIDFHRAVYDGFIKIAKQYDYISLLNGDLSPEIIHNKVITELSKLDSRFNK